MNRTGYRRLNDQIPPNNECLSAQPTIAQKHSEPTLPRRTWTGTLVGRLWLQSRSARGATIGEYALLVVFISIAALGGISFLGRSLEQRLCEAATMGQDTPETGSGDQQARKGGGRGGGIATSDDGGSTGAMPDPCTK